jgi:hypothetical protein
MFLRTFRASAFVARKSAATLRRALFNVTFGLSGGLLATRRMLRIEANRGRRCPILRRTEFGRRIGTKRTETTIVIIIKIPPP